MENLMFSLNATVPIFLLMLLGLLFRKLGWIDEEFAAKLNKFVFLVPLPVLLFLGSLESKVRAVLFCGDLSLHWDCGFVFPGVEG